MKSKVVIIILWAFTRTAWTQIDPGCTYYIEGTVKDLNTEEPLPYATILIKGTNLGTTTDESGHFRLDHICDKELDLVFSYVGYKPVEHHHDYHHPSIDVFLVPDIGMLESVIVEAEHHSGDLESTNSEKIDVRLLPTTATESLGDAISRIAGVSTISSGQNVVKPVIHGLHSNRILIINEGLRHEFQNWGEDHAPEIDPSLADQLEVIKGAATVRYGPDALGGVILIKGPALELSQPFKGEVQAVGKSNGRSGETSLRLQKGYRWISGLAEGSILKQGDLTAPDYLLTNTGKDETSYAAGLRFHPLPELDIETYYSHFEQELGILRGSVNSNLDDLLMALEVDTPNFTAPFSYSIGTPKQKVSHDLLKANIRWIGKKQSFSIQFGHQLNHRQEFDVRKGNDLEIPNIDLELESDIVDAEWRHPGRGAWKGKVGAQWSTQSNSNNEGTNTVPFVPNYNQKRYGLYAIEMFELTADLFEIGLRYDRQEAEIVGRQPNNLIYRNDLNFKNWSGTIGYRRKLPNKQVLRTNLGTAWRPPNIAELYRYGRHQSFIEYGLWRYEINEQTDFITTQNILTEEDRPVRNEIGYKWITSYEFRKDKLDGEVTGFVNYIENYIYAKPGGLTRTVRGATPFFIYDQTNALLWGLDFSLKWQHSQKFNSNIQANYLWSRQMPSKDYFVGQPPTRINWNVQYKPGKLGFLEDNNFGLELSYTFKQWQKPRILTIDELLTAYKTEIDLFVNDATDFDIAPPPDGYLLTNVYWLTHFHGLTINVEVRNLLNVKYRSYTDRLRYFADELGRNFILSLTYAW
ncbi:MAG: TonB-dependent receptor [Saprospiraceae bacterium]|nr:TonB-dependent receptor [Saprospiraceae bacterium]